MKKLTHTLLFYITALLLLASCESERPIAKLALQENGKTYLFSQLGSFLVENSLKNGEVPVIFGSTQIYEEDGTLFISPNMLEPVVNLMGGSYQLHPSEQKSHDGYVTLGEESILQTSYKVENTDKIGEQLYVRSMSISQGSDTFTISWKEEQNPYKATPLQNCEVKNLWVNRSTQPGVTSVVQEDALVVDMAKIADFYQKKVSLRYEASEGILYILRQG